MMANSDSKETDHLERAIRGDEGALAEVFEAYRGRLNRMIVLRMDPRIQGRLDAADVLQEAFIDAARGLSSYAAEPKIPFYLWLRLLTGQRLAKAHRTHLGDGDAAGPARGLDCLTTHPRPKHFQSRLATHGDFYVRQRSRDA